MSETLGLRPPAEHVHPNAKKLWRVTAGIGWGIFLVIGVVAPLVIKNGLPTYMWWWVVPIAFWLIFSVFVVPVLKYRIHRWEVSPDAIYTRTGWWTATTRIVPINRVQNVDLSQGVFARMFGIAHVDCSTAGDSITIGYLARQEAQQIVDGLTATMAADESDAT